MLWAMKAVILLSGGVESTTLLHMLAPDHALAPLFIDYGQRNARQEKRAAQWQCDQLGLSLDIMPASRIGHFFRGEACLSRHVPIPHRNLMAAALAAAWAAQIRADAVYLGINREDAAADAASTPEFIRLLRQSLQTLQLHLHTPLAELSKAAIVQLGLARNVDYRRTWSCLLGHARPCRQCPQCLKRQTAFAAAGLIAAS